MPKIDGVWLNRWLVKERMVAEALGLSDLARLTKKIDPDERGLAVSSLSELLSEDADGNVTREVTALRTVRLLADALDMRPSDLIIRRKGEPLPADLVPRRERPSRKVVA